MTGVRRFVCRRLRQKSMISEADREWELVLLQIFMFNGSPCSTVYIIGLL